MNGYVDQVRKWWDDTADSDWYMSLRSEEKIRGVMDEPWSAFHPGVRDVMERMVTGFSGKRVLLPSSGDNHAAFALAKMGARVTSADISSRQLFHGEKIASAHGLEIEFVQDDTMRLSKIPDGEFDLVYISNGTLTWINNLEGMYENFARVLKKGGAAIMYDIHPFGRPFSCEAWENPRVVKDYDDTLPSCHWRVSDILNAQAKAGFWMAEMQELKARDASYWFKYDELITKTPDELRDINDWRKNPMAALPAWICIAARKI